VAGYRPALIEYFANLRSYPPARLLDMAGRHPRLSLLLGTVRCDRDRSKSLPCILMIVISVVIMVMLVIVAVILVVPVTFV
jgi:hypothetical protein